MSTGWRRDFDAARDPYTARNALGITSTGGGPPAPVGAEYVTASADATLTNERVLTNTATVTWDFLTAGQAKATATIDLSAYATLASPTFTGDPKAPTPATADNDTSIATTAFVKAQGYATTASLGSYVLKAGDTMTGALTVTPTGVDGFQISGIASQARLWAVGPSTNVNSYYSTKGTGQHAFYTRDFGKAQLFINDANADRYVILSGGDSAAAGQPTISSGGTAGARLNLPDAVSATQPPGDNTLALATTAFVTAAIAALGYATGTWTPTLTFATPGDLAITYSARSGTYTKIGNLVVVHFDISTSAFTWTTASGNLQITGTPHSINAAVAEYVGNIDYRGITKATFTEFQLTAMGGTSEMRIIANASGVTRAFVVAADVPSGGAIVLRGSVVYQT